MFVKSCSEIVLKASNLEATTYGFLETSSFLCKHNWRCRPSSAGNMRLISAHLKILGKRLSDFEKEEAKRKDILRSWKAQDLEKTCVGTLKRR